MMTTGHFKNGLLLLAAAVLLFAASCLKTKDPAPVQPDPNLTNHYCNDPDAINYNWGFPGIPDSTVCIYPVDRFTGQWSVLDSVFYPDSSFNFAITRTLIFKSTEDSTRNHVSIQGFCSNGDSIVATVDKYGNGLIDSMNEQTAGQRLCSPADTVTGTFNLFLDSRDSMKLILTVRGADSGYHKGIAHKL